VAYFSLPSLTLPCYRFDYHSHFGGILPVEDETATAAQAVQLPVAYTQQGRDGTIEVDVNVQIAQGQQLSLAGAFGGAADAGQGRRGALSLFLKALALMEESNPLAILAASGNRQRYERGECIAEDIYIACVCLVRRLELADLSGAAATDPVLYKTVRGALESIAKRSSLPGAADTLAPLLPTLRYFNDKIYSASKYTPFDDAYRARSFALKKLRAEPGGEERYLQWMAMSLLYLENEGIGHAQLSLGEDEIRAANAVASSYNTARSTQYKLLGHTSAVYGGDKELERDLNTKLLPLFQDASLTEVVGIDLLGSENKVGNYAELFAFLTVQASQATPPLTQYFGSGANARALQFVNHIHCGEGMGVAADNRSAIGYAMAYSAQLPDAPFYRAYADYVLTCLAAAQGRQADHPRGSAGTHALSDNQVSGLFDELFRNDSLTVGGLTLRRYDGNSARTRELVAYAGKRNMMALCESLDLASAPPPAGAPPSPPPPPAPSYYTLLTAPATLLSFRLGHAYYYRSFVAARYPVIAFDTNLGSNAITGASGLFASVEGYRLNRGFRHLDGYVDTDLLAAVTDTVMFTGLQALSADQVNQLMELARSAKTLPLLFTAGAPVITPMLSAAMAPIIQSIGAANCYQGFQTLVAAMIGENQSRSVWFAALARALNLFINWRCYLLGSDAQGVEHTDIQDEYLRSVLLLAYNLVPFDSAPGATDVVGTQLQQLVGDVAAAYWQSTIGPLAGYSSQRQTTATIAGYKAPASVVTVTRSAAPA
jgi:hypothetical protein